MMIKKLSNQTIVFLLIFVSALSILSLYIFRNSLLTYNLDAAKKKTNALNLLSQDMSLPAGIGTIFVTEDGHDKDYTGTCDAISVYKYESDTILDLFHGPEMISPGRISAGVFDSASKTQLVVANASNDINGLYLLRPAVTTDGIDSYSYQPQINRGIKFDGLVPTFSGGIAVYTYDSFFLALSNYEPQDKLFKIKRGEKGPYYVQKTMLDYGVGDVQYVADKKVEFSAPVAEILISKVKKELYVLSTDSKLSILDLDTLSKKTELQLPKLVQDDDANQGYFPPTNFFHASLSYDGRFLITNEWKNKALIFVDLESPRPNPKFYEVFLPEESAASRTGGVAFNNSNKYYGSNPFRYIFALNGMRSLEVYEFNSDSLTITLLARKEIVEQYQLDAIRGPQLSVGWTVTGGEVVASDIQGVNEFSVTSFDGKNTLTPKGGLNACQGGNYPNDVSNNEVAIVEKIADVIPTATTIPTSQPLPTNVPRPTNVPSPTVYESSACTYGAISNIRVCAKDIFGNEPLSEDNCRTFIKEKNYTEINKLPRLLVSRTAGDGYTILDPELGTSRGSGNITTDYPQQLYYHKGANPHPDDHAYAAHEVFAPFYKWRKPATAYEIANVKLFYDDAKWKLLGKYCKDGDETNRLCPGYATDAEYTKFAGLNMQVDIAEKQYPEDNSSYKDEVIYGFDTRGCNRSVDYGWIVYPK